MKKKQKTERGSAVGAATEIKVELFEYFISETTRGAILTPKK